MGFLFVDKILVIGASGLFSKAVYLSNYPEYLSYGFGSPVYCNDFCSYIWDGFGRWMNESWKVFVPGKQYN